MPITSNPARASSAAADSPPGPIPTTITSTVSDMLPPLCSTPSGGRPRRTQPIPYPAGELMHADCRRGARIGEDGGMDLDAVAEELYDTAPEDLVALRTARAAEATAAGDRELAQQVRALRKPTRSAWIANLVA